VTALAPSVTTRQMPLRSALTILVSLAAVGFLALGLRGVLDPAGGASSLGVMVRDPADLVLMQAVGARNIGLALLGMSLIWIDRRRELGLLLAAAAGIALVDFFVIWSASGLGTAGKHLIYVGVLIALGLAVLRRR
jgi:hypothetical protein